MSTESRLLHLVIEQRRSEALDYLSTDRDAEEPKFYTSELLELRKHLEVCIGLIDHELWGRGGNNDDLRWVGC